jgi:succinate-semialdehyde dehydrogenase/glutarate-semialdehyde dehydrogenase
MTLAAATELRVVNPATLELVGAVPVTDAEGVAAHVAAARGAQAAWADTPVREKRAALERLARLVLDRADEIADTVVAETAKPRVEAFTTELYPALDAVTWLVKNAARVLAAERLRYRQPHLLPKRGWLLYEPRGVIGVISPWNFPFTIPFTQVAFCVAAGNGVVLKPSELTPLSSLLVARLFADAGVPSGLVGVAPGDATTGEHLVAAGVDKIVFTGSAAVGRQVAAVAGERLVPVTLELGGKDPMVVLDDADLPRAVDGALWSSFVNCGQVCSGVERIYVESALYEPFVEELARKARELGSSHDVGPLISEQQRDRVASLVEDAVAAGAHAVAGGRAPARQGWFYEPTVLTGVPRGARIEREEIFGPVVTVARAVDERAAVEAANDSAFGLGASVWTRDPARAVRAAGRLRAGSVWHNDHAYSYGAAQASWGGRGASGFGRTHSKHGLYELVDVKFVDRDRGRIPVPWWYPYDAGAAAAFGGALEALYGSRLRGLWRDRRALLALARRYTSRRLDGGSQGAEAPASPAPERDSR